MEIQIKKTDPRAKLPAYATEGSAGADLYALLDEAVEVGPGSLVQIHTGISLALPQGYAAFVYARSGLATKHGIIPANCVGVIDSDYRGEIMVTLTNLTDTPYAVEPFERIAQIVITAVECPSFSLTDELPQTGRGAGGFGSTGKI